jgi:MoaA/NifB/PqqE/SkfB family radical SAM enzyme
MIREHYSVKTYCALPFVRIKVTCEGDVTFCCFQERKCLGNILKDSFENIWNSELAQAVRRDTLNNKLHPTCSMLKCCPFAHMTEAELEAKSYWLDTRSVPTELEIDLPSQHCNIGGLKPTDKNPACVMCERNLRFESQEDRLEAVCAKLKPYAHNFNLVHIQGVAEAFWKDYLFRIAKWLRLDERKNRVAISTTTNGTVLTDDRIARFLEYPRSSLTFSLDAATPETYQLIRRLPLFDKIMQQAKKYNQQRTPAQIARVHNNINLLNIHEVVDMVRIAAELGMDEVEFNPTCNVPLITLDNFNVDVFRDAQKKIEDASTKYPIKVSFLRKLDLDFEKPELVQISVDRIKADAAKINVASDKLLQIAETVPGVRVQPTLLY